MTSLFSNFDVKAAQRVVSVYTLAPSSENQWNQGTSCQVSITTPYPVDFDRSLPALVNSGDSFQIDIALPCIKLELQYVLLCNRKKS